LTLIRSLLTLIRSLSALGRSFLALTIVSFAGIAIEESRSAFRSLLTLIRSF
jgi:hypothetical protein